MIRLAKRTAKRILRPVVNPWATRSRLVADLRRLGVRPGGVLLVHSSLSSLGYVPGGADIVIHALLDALGPGGTLVLPTHTFQQMNAGCRTFDANKTASCVGTLTQVFRQMPGVRRSLHPTHSVAAIGPLAGDIVCEHESASTPCGNGTPYARILDCDGQILLLGVGLKNLTVFHTIEAMAGVPYLLKQDSEEFVLIDADGCQKTVSLFRHEPGVRRCFPDTEAFLESEGALKRGHIGSARSFLVEGRTFRDSMMRRVREEPRFLLAE